MKKNIVLFLIAIIIIINHYFPYTLIKKINYYNYTDLNYTGNTFISVQLIPQKNTYLIIPLLLKLEIYKSPYSYNFSILGDFDEIKNINGYFTIDNKKVIINNFKLLNTDKYSGNWNGVFLYKGINEKINIDFATNPKIKFNIEFDGLKNGLKSSYKEEINLKSEYKEDLGNQLLWNIESI